LGNSAKNARNRRSHEMGGPLIRVSGSPACTESPRSAEIFEFQKEKRAGLHGTLGGRERVFLPRGGTFSIKSENKRGVVTRRGTRSWKGMIWK